MASQRPTSSLGAGKTYFEQQREAIIGDIAMVSHPAFPNLPLDHLPIEEEGRLT